MHRGIWAGTVLLVLTAATEITFAAEHAGAWRPLVIHKADPAPTVDGKLEEPCWKQADRRALRHYAGGELKVGGSAALCYDERNLYAAMWLDEPTPQKITSAAEPKGLWDGEVIEWFVCPSVEGSDYVQLAWNPAGRQFSVVKGPTWGGDPRRASLPDWRTASTIGERGWTTEAMIPFADLGMEPPEPGALWRSNLCRHRVVGGGKPEWSALSPTGPNGFHTLERFEDVHFAQ